MNGKRSALMLFVAIGILGMSAQIVEGQEIVWNQSENDGTEEKASPSLLFGNGFFSFASLSEADVPALESPVLSGEKTELTQEELILLRWKEKQLDRWEYAPIGTFEINASAYTAAADECGKSDGITASGLVVAAHRTIACPPEYPFGIKIAIEGLGIYRCEDRGGAIKGNKFDIYMETKPEAFAFGRQTLLAKVVVD